VLSRIFLDFWKYNFIVHLLRFESFLIWCLEVEVIKRLLWPLNEPTAPLKTVKNGLQLTSLISSTILELEKYLENNVLFLNIKLKILFYKLFYSF